MKPVWDPRALEVALYYSQGHCKHFWIHWKILSVSRDQRLCLNKNRIIPGYSVYTNDQSM